VGVWASGVWPWGHWGTSVRGTSNSNLQLLIIEDLEVQTLRTTVTVGVDRE